MTSEGERIAALEADASSARSQRKLLFEDVKELHTQTAKMTVAVEAMTVQLEDLTDELKELNAVKNRGYGALTVLAIVSGGVGAGFTKIITGG